MGDGFQRKPGGESRAYSAGRDLDTSCIAGKQTLAQHQGPSTIGPIQRKAVDAPASASSVPPKPSSATTPAANGLAGPASGNLQDDLIRLLASMPPSVGGDPAVIYLNTLATPALLATLTQAVDRGYAPRLHIRLASASPVLVAALYAAELARSTTMTPDHPLLVRAGVALDHVSRDQQLQILSFLLHRRGVSIEATTLVEGVIAMREGGDQDRADASREQQPAGAGRGAADDAGVPVDDDHVIGTEPVASITSGPAPAPVSPRPWEPPGAQPGGFYVGGAAHTAIGDFYRVAHPGELIFTNHTPLSSILKALEQLSRDSPKPNRAALAESDLARRPDIANMRRRHLYEIKPAKAQAEAAATARAYLSIFEGAGVEMTLGPVGEPGTIGALPAPAGVFMFRSPEPGVITYDYRRGRLVPVPVAQPEPSKERSWRWELQPLTPTQKQAIVTTTVGGAMLLLVMVILAPVGA
jgi:hypothetical protein